MTARSASLLPGNKSLGAGGAAAAAGSVDAAVIPAQKLESFHRSRAVPASRDDECGGAMTCFQPKGEMT